MNAPKSLYRVNEKGGVETMSSEFYFRHQKLPSERKLRRERRKDDHDSICVICGEIAETEVETKQGPVDAHPRCVASQSILYSWNF